MDDADGWTMGVPAGLAALGAVGGALALARGLDPVGFGAMVFVGLIASCMLATQLHRRGLRRSVPVGAASCALFVLAFFAVPLAPSLAAGVAVDATAVALLLVALPLAAALVAAGGTRILVHGVDRYRAEHGLRHAPAQR